MPHVTFQLKQRCHTFSSKVGSDDQTLGFSANVSPPFYQHTFLIIDGEKIYDGFKASVSISFTRRPPRSEVPGIPAQNPYDANDVWRDSFLVSCPEDGDGSPWFSLSVSLPPDAYQRLLDCDMSEQKVELLVETLLMGGPLIYGNDPDGREVEWHVEKGTYTFPVGTSLRLFSKRRKKTRSGAESKVSAPDDAKIDPNESVIASAERVRLAVEALRKAVIRSVSVAIVVLILVAIIK